MNIAFQTINWANIPKTIHPGITGTACWQTFQLPGLRIRLVEYSPGYQAGHIVHCLEGELLSEMETGEQYILTAGMSYVVSDGLSSHRSITKEMVKLLIVDGDFLKQTHVQP
mgnify:FL=1